jgi:bacterioferritin-associated ferredoxin
MPPTGAPDVRIDRCVCHKVTFAEVRDWCTKHPRAGLEEVQREFGCGTGCGLCEPYVRRMMRTGQVVFTEIVIDRDEPRG